MWQSYGQYAWVTNIFFIVTCAKHHGEGNRTWAWDSMAHRCSFFLPFEVLFLFFWAHIMLLGTSHHLFFFFFLTRQKALKSIQIELGMGLPSKIWKWDWVQVRIAKHRVSGGRVSCLAHVWLWKGDVRWCEAHFLWPWSNREVKSICLPWKHVEV
jgi:hypothetical protein